MLEDVENPAEEQVPDEDREDDLPGVTDVEKVRNSMLARVQKKKAQLTEAQKREQEALERAMQLQQENEAMKAAIANFSQQGQGQQMPEQVGQEAMQSQGGMPSIPLDQMVAQAVGAQFQELNKNRMQDRIKKAAEEDTEFKTLLEKNKNNSFSPMQEHVIINKMNDFQEMPAVIKAILKDRRLEREFRSIDTPHQVIRFIHEQADKLENKMVKPQQAYEPPERLTGGPSSNDYNAIERYKKRRGY